MSKILRRPMFRGGPVDSRGTGITSGLMDGGRVGYNQGKLVLGGDLYSKEDFSKFIQGYRPNMSPALINNLFDRKTGELKPGMTYENIFEAKDEEDKPISVFDADIFDFSKVGIKGDKANRLGAKMTGKDDFADALKTDVLDKLKESKAYEPEFRGGGADAAQADFGKEKLNVETQEDIPITNINNNNQEESTEIDPKTLMRENAELFKELLGEANEKKLKDARIQDASDYLLKFFEGSQKEGATVGSAAADVAAFATAKDSRTERAKAAIDKQDQTAVALSINDYIAGKRSKEQVEAMIAKSDLALSNKKAAIDYANRLTQGFDALPGFIADSKAIGYAGRVVDGLRKSGLSQFPMEKVTSKEMEEQFEFDPETDTGKIFIETDTKTTYTFRSDGTKRIIDQG